MDFGYLFKKFREVFLNNVKLTNIHLFVSRDKVFNKENVLQETMILRALKTNKEPKDIIVTQSYSNDDFDNISTYNIDYSICVEKENERYVYLPLDSNDIKVLKTINGFNTKLKDIGLKLKTGLTVDFRNEEYLEKNASNNNVPLLSSIHFKDGIIKFPVMKMKLNMLEKIIELYCKRIRIILLIKRFSSKEEKKKNTTSNVF